MISKQKILPKFQETCWACSSLRKGKANMLRAWGSFESWVEPSMSGSPPISLVSSPTKCTGHSCLSCPSGLLWATVKAFIRNALEIIKENPSSKTNLLFSWAAVRKYLIWGQQQAVHPGSTLPSWVAQAQAGASLGLGCLICTWGTGCLHSPCQTKVWMPLAPEVVELYWHHQGQVLWTCVCYEKGFFFCLRVRTQCTFFQKGW